MNKIYYSLGLMSGTSSDGVDASIIKSDGENELKIIDNLYKKYDQNLKNSLHQLINEIKNLEDLKKRSEKIKKIEQELTIEHANLSSLLIDKNKNIHIDFVGFHGHTIIHKPKDGYSIQIGDPKLLSKKIKKIVFFNFRKKDILNGGEGAPLSPIYHKLIYEKTKLTKPLIFLNIGGIANITVIDSKNNLISEDVGPGNCLIDKWMRVMSKKDFDENGDFAKSGKVDQNILNKILDHEVYKKSNSKSLDIKDFDITFAKGLTLEDGSATISDFTSQLICNAINKYKDNFLKIIVCGGGRKNNYLMNRIAKLTKLKIIDIDKLGFDGNFIESQTFAYLAIRSHLKKNISFPSTTGVKLASTGGEIFKNF